LTDAEGRTLYIFVNDSRNTNNFTNEDFSNDAVWPIFYVDIEALPGSLDEADFGVISVFGRDQLTYRGWPLYYFGQDAERGENKGISFPRPGIWPIANLDTPEAEV
jgi:predicted lipoprotein with Yx(FWY)xxD motif